MSTIQTLGVLAAAAVLAVPASQLVWVPLTHLKFSLYHRGREGAPPPLGLAGTLGTYRRAVAANLVMAWWLLRAAGRDGLRQPAGEATGPPVLLVHGFLRNGSCTWGLRSALERQGRPTRAVSMGRPLRRVERYAPKLEAALFELTEAFPGEPIDVVAHSMGGVVLRLVLARQPSLAAAVGRIVTLGSPHAGTAAARGGRLAPELSDLAAGSPFLAELPDFRASAPQAEVITVAAERDFVVYPRSTSHLAGARAVDFPRYSHPGLLTEGEVIDFVAGALTAPTAEG